MAKKTGEEGIGIALATITCMRTSKETAEWSFPQRGFPHKAGRLQVIHGDLNHGHAAKSSARHHLEAKTSGMICMSHLLKECVWPVLVKHLGSPHDGDQIFCLAQVDDIVCPSRLHPYPLNAISRYLILFDLVVFQIPHLNQATPFDNDEDLVLAVVPMLPLDTGTV